MMNFQGYRRADGRIGVRNYVIVLPSVICANTAAERIAANVPGAVALPHATGCSLMDPEQVLDVLVGIGRHPNVAAVLVVGLGCEQAQARLVAERIAESGKPTETLVIQEAGGVLKTIGKGTPIVSAMVKHASLLARDTFPASELVLATECGGSDFTSGIASNPVIGSVSDRLIAEGGTVVLSETMELMGAEHILARRAVTPAVGQCLLDIVEAYGQAIAKVDETILSGQPTPGNMAGGITTIEEKSLGCIYKGGTAPVQGVLRYAETVPGHGLYVMDTPGQDAYSLTGMAAGGAQVILFSTGRGSPLGFPIVPVIKICGNRDTLAKMGDHIDYSTVPLVEGRLTAAALGAGLFDLLAAVSSGQLTAAELIGHREFAIYEGIGPVL